MGEPRRIDIISNVGMNLDKTKDTEMPTIRLNIQLPESTDQKCPEFSYSELCKNVMEEKSEASQIDPTDPFAVKDEMEHDNMLAIAKNFEMKYGPQPGKKKHLSLLEDFVDLGEGYEEDSFVDNSEAYDELVPSTMTTKLGGFYINCGTLDFVSLDERSLDGEPLKKKDKKRKVIESDNEENENSDNKKKLHKIKENGGGEPVKKKHKKLVVGNMEEGKCRKDPPGRVLKPEKSMTVAEILNQANCAPTLTAIKPPPSTSLPVSLSLPLPLPSHLGSTPTTPEIPQNLLLSPVRKTILNATIEKLSLPPPPLLPLPPTISQSISVPASSFEVPAEKDNASILKIESSIESVILKSREEDPKSVDIKSERPEHVLPESFHPGLLKAINRIKDMAAAAVKQPSDAGLAGLRFTPGVQELLREIYDHVQKLSSNDRLVVYSNLALYFPCGKEALIKRVKKLNLTQHDDKLKQPIDDLKEAIQKVMPSLIEKHRVEVSAKEKQRLDQIQEIKERKVETKEGAAQSDSEDDDENRDVGERQRRIVAPRKKFEWNAEIRNYLCKVVDIKMEHYEMSKIRSQAPEDYLKGFLEGEVKPLWPSGWMQMRMLFKESRLSHSRWTGSSQSKLKKNAVVGPKTSTPIASTSLEIVSELGLCHQTGNFVSYCTPISVPFAKSISKPFHDEFPQVAPINLNKFTTNALHADSDAANGLSTDNNNIEHQSQKDSSIVTICTKTEVVRAVSDKEGSLIENRDFSFENEPIDHRIRSSGSSSSVILTGIDISGQRQVPNLKSVQEEKSLDKFESAAIMVEISDESFLDRSKISSSCSDVLIGTDGQESSANLEVIKSEITADHEPATDSPQQDGQGPDTTQKGFLNEFLHFSSQNTLELSEGDNERPRDEIKDIEKKDFSHSSGSVCQSSSISLSQGHKPHQSASTSQLISGKESSEMHVVTLTRGTPDPGRVTSRAVSSLSAGTICSEVKPMRRQSSIDSVSHSKTSENLPRKPTAIVAASQLSLSSGYNCMAGLYDAQQINNSANQSKQSMKNNPTLISFSSSAAVSLSYNNNPSLSSTRTVQKSRNAVTQQMTSLLLKQQNQTCTAANSTAQKLISNSATQGWGSTTALQQGLAKCPPVFTSAGSAGRTLNKESAAAHTSLTGGQSLPVSTKVSSSKAKTDDTYLRNLSLYMCSAQGQAGSKATSQFRTGSASLDNLDQSLKSFQGSQLAASQIWRPIDQAKRQSSGSASSFPGYSADINRQNQNHSSATGFPNSNKSNVALSQSSMSSSLKTSLPSPSDPYQDAMKFILSQQSKASTSTNRSQQHSLSSSSVGQQQNKTSSQAQNTPAYNSFKTDSQSSSQHRYQ